MNNVDKWKVVDKYITDLLVPTDSILEEVLQVNAEANLPAHDVSPTQGKFLQLLVQIRGSVIIGDNVVREGEVIDTSSDDPRVQGIRRFYELIANEPRVTATAIQTVESKGYDGFVMALVTE